MADTRDNIQSIDLGIESTGVAGNLKAVEAFLSGDDTILNSDPEEIEEIEDEEEVPVPKKPQAVAKPKQAAPPKKEEPKKEVDPFAEFAEDEPEEDPEEDPKKAVAKPAETNEETTEDPENEEVVNDYNALAKDLFKIGVFTKLDDEDDQNPDLTTPEALKERFEKQGQTNATQWLESFLARNGDDRRELFEAIFINGVDPKEYLPVYNDVQNLKEANIEDESVQEKVYREYYKRLGWKSDVIERKLQKAKDYGDLADETKELHEQIVSQDEANLQEMKEAKIKEEAQAQQIDQAYKLSIAKILEDKSKEKDFDGIPINDKKKNQAFDFLYTKKYKTPSGELLTEFDKFILDTRRPENHALRVKMALLALDNFDLTKVEKRGVSKESSAIFTNLAQKVTKKGGAKTGGSKVTSWFQ